MESDVQQKNEQTPRKTKLPTETSPSPSKQRRQRQNVKLKLESLMQKEPELTRRRPVRKASRKNYYPDTLIVLVCLIYFTSIIIFFFWWKIQNLNVTRILRFWIFQNHVWLIREWCNLTMLLMLFLAWGVGMCFWRKKHIVSEGKYCRKCSARITTDIFFLRVRMISYCSDRSCNTLVEALTGQHCMMICLILFIFFKSTSTGLVIVREIFSKIVWN